MDQASKQGNNDALSLTQAVAEAKGLLTYQTLWRAVQAGQLEVFQPRGKGSHYRITRSELQRFLQPVIKGQK